VITDDLQAAAITEAFGRDEAIARAVEAGNDLLLFANQQTYDADIVDRVVTTIAGFVASGRISEARIDESFARVEAFAATG
jgi:beta-N-acetylhexosaminidase